jgi:hypothetical protein
LASNVIFFSGTKDTFHRVFGHSENMINASTDNHSGEAHHNRGWRTGASTAITHAGGRLTANQDGWVSWSGYGTANMRNRRDGRSHHGAIMHITDARRRLATNQNRGKAFGDSTTMSGGITHSCSWRHNSSPF